MTRVARQSATKTAKKTLPDLPVVDDKTIDFETIENLFFAYRDFVSDPDAILAKLGYGRAHHRVVHFVNRRPGMTVADLVKTTVYLTDPKDIGALIKAGQKYNPGGQQAGTLVYVKALALPEVKIEIEAVAAKPVMAAPSSASERRDQNSY